MVVVGSVNVDLMVRVGRLPAPGETVIGGAFMQSQGGKGANQAAAAARLGARTWLVGMVGEDEFGAAARADLGRFGVDLSFLGTAAAPTGVAEILVDEHGENLIAVASGANAALAGEAVANAVRSVPTETAVVLACLEVGDEAVLAAARAATERGFRFVLNPAPARPVVDELVAACAALTPNRVEVAQLGSGSADDLLARGAGAVVVTLGAGGADLYRPGAPVLHRSAFRVDVADTTGAGDCFSAALAWALADGRPLEDAVDLAAAAAALSARAFGARAGLPTRADVERLVGSTG